MVTDVWCLEPSGRTTLPLTDGCPFRKSALITKVQIWAATWEEVHSLGHPGVQPSCAKRLAAPASRGPQTC